MKADKIIQIGTSALVVAAVVSTTIESLDKEPANLPNVAYEQTPHTPDNQQPVPEYALVETTASSPGTAVAPRASGSLAAKLIAAGML